MGLNIPRLGGYIYFGYGEAGNLTVPYDFYNGDLAAGASSAGTVVPSNFSNLTMVIKRPTTSYGSIVVLESRASSTDPNWTPVFTLDCNTTDTLDRTYLYPANVFQTRGPTMKVWRRKRIIKEAVQWSGQWGGHYNGWGLVAPPSSSAEADPNPDAARFNPWRGQHGSTVNDWGDNNAKFTWPNQPFTMTTNGVTISKSFSSESPYSNWSIDVLPQFGVHYAWNDVPTKPGPLAVAKYGFVSAKGNWRGSEKDNTSFLYGPREGQGTQVTTTVHSVAVVACRNTNPNNYGKLIIENKTVDKEYMTYKSGSGLLTGMHEYFPNGIDESRQFRVRNTSNSVINVHFFAAKYTVPSAGGATAFFSNVTVNPWGRLEIPMAADFRVEQLMTVQPSTSYPHYTNNTLSTQYCPSGLVSDYEGDRRTYAAPAKPSSDGHGGGGGGYATKGANSGAVSGGPARIAGPYNIPVTLVDPQTVITETDAKLLGFIPGQGLEKNVSGSGNNTGQLDAETYIEYISGNEMRLNKSHVSIDNIASTKMHVNALHYDLDRLYDAPFNRTKPWTMLLDSQHLGSPGGDGGDTDTYPGKGGSGGGAIRMVVRYMNLSGRIWAIGASGAQGRATHGGTYEQWSRSDGGGGGGGGSGGTIWLIAQNLSGGYGTQVSGLGLAPGLSPMCLMDQAYWNFPDLHGEEAGDGSLPIIMNLSSGPVNVSGNISVNGGDGGQSGLQGDARPVWRPEKWERGTAFSATPELAYAADPGLTNDNVPFAGEGIAGTSNALGTEKRFTPNFFYYYKITGWEPPTYDYGYYESYSSNTNNGATSYTSNGLTPYKIGMKITPIIESKKFEFPNNSGNEAAETEAAGLAWAAVNPSVGTPKAFVDAQIVAETFVREQITYPKNGGGTETIASATITPTYNANAATSTVDSIPYTRLTSLKTLNGLTDSVYDTPWLDFVKKAWVGNAYQLSATVQKEAYWGEWDGDDNGQNGGAGSAGRVRVDIGRLDGFNYQGITVTRKAGTLNANPTPIVAASWDAGETGRTPRDGTIYPSPDLVKWYDPTHNFVYPGNGPLWEV